MGKHTFIDLPDEAILHAMSFLDPQTLSRSQQVCRKLHSLIINSPHCTYILTLHSLGYALPLVPREDLTFTERIELLREHRTSWSHPERLIAEKYDLNPDPLSTYKYIGGVFAQGLAGGVWPGQPTYNMRFHQLPSKNLGTGFKEWAFYDLGTGMVEFTIDPDQNLFALIEFLRPDHPSRGPLEFRIHLKTLDTNEPHPGALLATLATTVDPVLTEAIELEQQLLHVHSEISGAVLATSFAISEDSLASWVVVYDWRRGTELTRVPVLNSKEPMFVLLSQQMLMIPRSLEPDRWPWESWEGPLTKDNYGTLDVYAFDPLCNAPTPPLMTASFALPLRYPTHIGANITIEHVPCTGSSTSYGRVRPKVYDLLPQDGSIYLIMSVHERSFCERDSNPSCRDAGALHIPANVFLDARYHPQDKSLAIEVSVGDTYKYSYDPIVVPWRRWAHRTTWMDVREFGGRSEGSVYGHRMAFSHGYRCPPSHLGYRAPSMGLVDFHCRRLRWRELFEVGPGVGVIPPSTFTSIWRELGYEIFCGKHYAAAQKSCMGNMFQVEEDVFTLYKVIVDNERIIVVQTERHGQGSSLLVYSF